MKFKIFYALAFFFTLSIINVSAQSSRKQPLKLVKYKDNVKAPLTIKERTMLKEVYADKFEEYVLNRPQKLKDLKNLIRNRVLIKEMPELIPNKNKYSTIKEAGLFNSYNSNLTFDEVYDSNTFNVLKYNLEFFTKGSRIYRINNSNFFIVILSQHK